MPGTSEGNKKAAQTSKERYGKDFHEKIGAKSWKNPNRSHKVGFAKDPELARRAGSKGGKNKHAKKTKVISEEEQAYLDEEALLKAIEEANQAADLAETQEERTGPSE